MVWKLGITGDTARARCFTYDGIFRHADVKNAKIRRLTLDRNIRKLRERGILYSFKYGRKTVVYCLQREIAESMLKYLHDTGIINK